MRCSGSVGLRLSAIGLLFVVLVGCGGYGEVTPAAYEYAKALYGVANRRAADRLDGVAERVSAAEDAGEITPREAAWLGDIVDAAREGDWEDAARRARRIMQDQVG